MGKIASAKELPEAAFDLAGTFESVQFLMRQLNGIDRPPITRIKIPSGGGMAFEIPNGTDEPDVEKSIEGIIVYHHAVNAYWPGKFSGGREEPECASSDGLSGWDKDRMEYNCRNCPKNRMGSAQDGRGKACKNMTRLLVLREGESFPVAVILPPMSISNFAAYMTHLAPMRLTVNDVVTKITLMRATNRDGIQYSQAQFVAVGAVDREKTLALKRAMAPILMPEAADSLMLDEGAETA